MTCHSPLQKLKEAKQIALDHDLFVVEKDEKYLLYRKLALRNDFIGSRSTPEALRQFVCRVTNFH